MRSRSCSPQYAPGTSCPLPRRSWPLPSLAGAAVEAVDVILRDGGTLRLRPPTTADAAALVAFFGGLSAESRDLRFHGARRVDETLVAPFLEPDWADRGALLGSLDG